MLLLLKKIQDEINLFDTVNQRYVNIEFGHLLSADEKKRFDMNVILCHTHKRDGAGKRIYDTCTTDIINWFYGETEDMWDIINWLSGRKYIIGKQANAGGPGCNEFTLVFDDIVLKTGDAYNETPKNV